MLRYTSMALSAFIVCAALVALTSQLAARTETLRETATPFECGFDPKNSARMPFSLHFFLLAVIFLIFDVEIALLLPLPVALTKTIPLTLLAAMPFLLILLAGLAHEWSEGSLNWV
nr:NADH dehydrogenase subunit 3 [Notomastus sp. GK-2021]